MSWLTLIWSASGGACLTLGIIHLLVWCQKRTLRASLWFSGVAFGVAGIARIECAIMRATTPEHFLMLHRWGHVAFFVITISIIGFIQSYFQTGRPWLAWILFAHRAVVLVMTFVPGPTFNFRSVSAMMPFGFFGETLMAPRGVSSPWEKFGEASGLVLVIYILDAAIRLWKRGGRRDHQRALVVGGGVLLFISSCFLNSFLIHGGFARGGVPQAPYFISLSFLFIVVAMGFELSRDLFQVTQLASKLRENAESMSLAASAARMALWRWDIPNDTFWVSQDGHSLYGVPPNETIDLNRFLETLHPDDREPTRQLVLRTLDGDGDFHASYRVIHPDGSTRWIDARGSTDFDNRHQPLRMRGVSIDVTDRIRAENDARGLRQDLAHAGRVTLLGQLASALAHELSQPLGAMLRNSEAAEIILQQPAPDLEELRAIVHDIHADDRRASAVIDRLRSLLKKRDLQVQPVDLKDVISEVVHLLRSDATARSIELRISVAEKLPPIQGDRVHLSQVLLNLVVNAMDAIDLGEPNHRCVTLAASPEAGGRMDVSVRDSGPGIPADVMSRLFEPFFTTKSHGMGMGLPVSRTLVEAHHGTLSACNLPDGGAEFHISLPITPLP